MYTDKERCLSAKRFKAISSQGVFEERQDTAKYVIVMVM